MNFKHPLETAATLVCENTMFICYKSELDEIYVEPIKTGVGFYVKIQTIDNQLISIQRFTKCYATLELRFDIFFKLDVLYQNLMDNFEDGINRKFKLDIDNAVINCIDTEILKEFLSILEKYE